MVKFDDKQNQSTGSAGSVLRSLEVVFVDGMNVSTFAKCNAYISHNAKGACNKLKLKLGVFKLELQNIIDL